ncbi:Short-chain-fatty-acid--CoA ligase [compost metagenome]
MKITTNMHEGRRTEMYACGAWNDMIITDYLEMAVTKTPQKTALVGYRVHAGDRSAMSYAELDRRITRMAAGLAALGVEKGDVVSCQLPNWWQMSALFLACVRIGAVCNPLMPIFREHEMQYMLAHAQSKVVVIPGTFRNFDHQAMLQGLRGELPDLCHVLVIGGDGEQSFEQVLLERAWETECDTAKLFAERRPGADEVVQLLYTSGTTGKPKGVMHTSNTLLSNIRPFSERQGLSAAEIILMPSPLAHQLGFLYGLMLPVYLGASAILQDVWEPAFAARVVAEEGCSLTLGSTPFLADLVDIARDEREQLASLKTFISAGAPIPGALVEKAAGVMQGTKIISAWGMTENGAVTTTRPQDPQTTAVHSDGVALPYMQVKIVDGEGHEMPAGEEGDLLVRGASQCVGYFRQPDMYQLDNEGWFATGDIARKDAAGYIRITGRSKDVVIRGGENLPIADIENTLYKHPAIQAVALVGAPDERLGERLCAYVTLHDSSATLTLKDVTDYLVEQKFTRQYLPEYLEVLAALPRTPSGKIQKFKLRDMAKDIFQNQQAHA